MNDPTTNLLTETLAALHYHNKRPADVEWVGTLTHVGTWVEFAARASHFDYDPGYGGYYVALELKVVGADWWLERREYDGSEWWHFSTLPTKPVSAKRLDAKSLSSREYSE